MLGKRGKKMKEKIISFSKKNYLLFFNLYYISIFLKSTTLIIDYPTIYILEKIIRIIAFVPMVIRAIIVLPNISKLLLKAENNEKRTKNKIIFLGIIIVAIALLVNAIKTRNIRLLLIGVVVISAYNIDIKKILKNILILQLCMTLFVITCSIFGITQDYIIPRENGEVRHSLGFAYTTNLSQIVLFACFIYLYLKDFRIKIEEGVILEILNVLIFYLTDSKTEIFFFQIMIVVCVLKNMKQIKLLIPKISNLFAKSYIVLIILSIGMVLIYPLGGIMKSINSALSGRLSIQNEVISDGNVKLFGSNIKMVGYGIEDVLKYGGKIKYNYIDSEYIQILVINGIIAATFMVIILSKVLLKLNEKMKYKDLFFIYIFLIFGLVNPRIIDLMYSPVLFFVIPTLLNEKLAEGDKNVKNYNK